MKLKHLIVLVVVLAIAGWVTSGWLDGQVKLSQIAYEPGHPDALSNPIQSYWVEFIGGALVICALALFMSWAALYLIANRLPNQQESMIMVFSCFMGMALETLTRLI